MYLKVLIEIREIVCSGELLCNLKFCLAIQKRGYMNNFVKPVIDLLEFLMHAAKS